MPNKVNWQRKKRISPEKEYFEKKYFNKKAKLVTRLHDDDKKYGALQYMKTREALERLRKLRPGDKYVKQCLQFLKHKKFLKPVQRTALNELWRCEIALKKEVSFEELIN